MLPRSLSVHARRNFAVSLLGKTMVSNKISGLGYALRRGFEDSFCGLVQCQVHYWQFIAQSVVWVALTLAGKWVTFMKQPQVPWRMSFILLICVCISAQLTISTICVLPVDTRKASGMHKRFELSVLHKLVWHWTEPVRAQPTTEGEEEAEEAWQNAASVSSEGSLAVGPEHSEDTTAEESEMEDSGSYLKSVG